MRKTPLKRVGKKYKKELDVFNKSTKPLWLKMFPACQFKCDDGECGWDYGCTVHHKMRRGKYLNDLRYFMTVCQSHHVWIEDHKKEARKRGYILYD